MEAGGGRGRLQWARLLRRLAPVHTQSGGAALQDDAGGEDSVFAPIEEFDDIISQELEKAKSKETEWLEKNTSGEASRGKRRGQKRKKASFKKKGGRSQKKRKR